MRRLAFLLILSLMLFASCATSGSFKPYSGKLIAAGTEALPAVYRIEYQDDNIIVDGDLKDGGFYIGITNRTSNVITIDLNQSSLVAGGFSFRAVEGATRKLDTAKAQPLFIIAPGSTAVKSIYRADGLDIASEEPEEIYLAYIIDEKTYYAEIQTVKEEDAVEEVKPVYQNEGYLGKVFIDKCVLHFLFTNKITEEQIENWLSEEAWHRYGYYGKKIDVYNIKYSTNWSAWSLLLYYNILGYVDKLEASADVYSIE